jgi:hypothetical protein
MKEIIEAFLVTSGEIINPDITSGLISVRNFAGFAGFALLIAIILFGIGIYSEAKVDGPELPPQIKNALLVILVVVGIVTIAIVPKPMIILICILYTLIFRFISGVLTGFQVGKNRFVLIAFIAAIIISFVINIFQRDLPFFLRFLLPLALLGFSLYSLWHQLLSLNGPSLLGNEIIIFAITVLVCAGFFLPIKTVVSTANHPGSLSLSKFDLFFVEFLFIIGFLFGAILGFIKSLKDNN